MGWKKNENKIYSENKLFSAINKLELHHYIYLFVCSLFLGIVSVELFSDGMFMDGLLYASISRNMAEGLGSFWKPYLTYCLNPEFYGHPPLGLGLQSLFFSVFGDSIYVERLYSLFTYIIVAYLIVLIWGKLTKNKKYGWLPIFLWFITGGVAWAAANNILENTMGIFVTLSVLFYLNSMDGKRFLWITLSGLSLSAGFLTKGFFCLYIWGVPFFMVLFKRNKSFIQAIMDTLIIILFTLLPIMFLYFIFPDAQNNMLNYINKQVIGSLQNAQTVDTRFSILWGFCRGVSIPLMVGFIIVLIALKKQVPKLQFSSNIRELMMFTTIALSGVLPIMISMKQSDFYILTVYPFFSIGLAYYLYPIVKFLISEISIESKGGNIFKGVTIGVVVLSIILSISQINRVGRDKEMIYDSKAVMEIIGKNTTINICPQMYSNWSLHGYFSRYGNVSLESNQENICQYYLSMENCDKNVLEKLEKHYKEVPLKTMKFKLYVLEE